MTGSSSVLKPDVIMINTQSSCCMRFVAFIASLKNRICSSPLLVMFFTKPFSFIWKRTSFNRTFTFRTFQNMKFGMFRFITQFKITQSIISFFSIDMMNDFVLFQKSTKVFFHNQSVFSNIIICWSFWMSSIKKHYISCGSYISSFKNRKIWSFFTKPIFSCMSFIHKCNYNTMTGNLQRGY